MNGREEMLESAQPSVTRRLCPTPKWAKKRVCTMCTPWTSDPVVSCLRTWVTVLHQHIGDTSEVLGGDTSTVLMGG